MQKRGQFYIIAAALIIVVIFGLTTVVNHASGTQNTARFYDLSSNFDRESVKIVDNGIYNKNSQGDVEKRLFEFYQNYSDYARVRDSGISIAFVYGNRERAVVAKMNPEESTTNIFGLANESNGVSSGTNVLALPSLNNVEGSNVTVQINGERKEFNLKDDENFYFIMVSSRAGEVLVSENG